MITLTAGYLGGFLKTCFFGFFFFFFDITNNFIITIIGLLFFICVSLYAFHGFLNQWVCIGQPF